MAHQAYNFTDRVRQVLRRAREVALEMHHEYVGTEHLAIAVAMEPDGPAATVLDALGARRDDIVARVRGAITPGSPERRIGPDLPYTSRAKKVLELTMAEARLLRHDYVGTEHLLLGILAEQVGIGAQVLSSLGVTADRARAETRALVGSPGGHGLPADQLVAQAAAPGYARSRSPYGVALVDDFTGRARDTLRAAYEEADARDHGAVELAHILLALASREDGMAVVVLDQVVGSRKRVAEALVERLPDKEQRGERKALQLSPESQQALDSALLEASKDGHRRAGTQHILLAVLDGLPLALAAACAQLGLTAKAARAAYERMKE
jgi:ATP-dependent Clp protease ATP-binding subunit ClpC